MRPSLNKVSRNDAIQLTNDLTLTNITHTQGSAITSIISASSNINATDVGDNQTYIDSSDDEDESSEESSTTFSDYLRSVIHSAVNLLSLVGNSSEEV